MGYRTNEIDNAELTELRERLHKAENQLRKYQKRKERKELLGGWWHRNKPSEEFCFWTFLGTVVAVVVVFLCVCVSESNAIVAQTEARAVQMAVEHFHSSRATARCFDSPERGMLCEIRNGQSKVLVRCDTETCWSFSLSP